MRIESGALDGAPIPTDRAVRMRPGQENLEIRYTGLTFINAERMVFKYQLHGVDRDWVYAGTRRLAHYAHISPGSYTFSVLAANSDGVWTDVPATLAVVVLPPYWQTWTFRATASQYSLRCVSTHGRSLHRIHLQRCFRQARRRRAAMYRHGLHDGLGRSC
jgi:hypothetical protein